MPEHLQNKVDFVRGPIKEVVQQLNKRDFNNLYIDGGKLIQIFLQKDMIDELVIWQIPILLGGGSPLFGVLKSQLMFEHIQTKILINAIVKSPYKRIR